VINEKISVCIPVYNGAATIKQTIESVLSQTMTDFELVVVDNVSTDKTVDIVKFANDERIKLYVNDKNIGAAKNLEVCKNKAKGEIIYYVCADDVLDREALKNTYEAFQISDDIGVVARPYYWFDEDISKAVRAKKQFKENQIVSINDNYEKVTDVFRLLDQVSGIGLRKKYICTSFSTEYFVEMASVVVPVFKKTKAVILKGNPVAVRIGDGTRIPSLYVDSPMLAWNKLVTNTFCEEKFTGLRKYLINNFVANNFIGLIQIKNFGGFKSFIREVYYLIKLKWLNIISLRFWFFFLGILIVPRFLLRKMAVVYKNNINSRFLKDIVIIDRGKR